MPYYILINRAPFDIEVQEFKRPADPRIIVKKAGCSPLWPKSEECRMLRAKIVDTDEITAPFQYDDVQCSLLRLNNKFGGINVDVHATEGVIYITFYEYHPGDAPGLIINCTNEEMSFWEKGNVNKIQLKPNHLMYYTWFDPAGERVLTWKNVGNDNCENDLRRDGVDQFLPSNDFNESGSSKSKKRPSSQMEKVYWVSFLDGTQRILMFTNNPSIANATQSSNRLDQVSLHCFFKFLMKNNEKNPR